MKTHYRSSNSAVELYGIVGSSCQRFDYAAPTQQAKEELWPLLNQRGGPVPTAPRATFEVALSAQSAQVFFYHSGEMIAVAAIAMSPGEESCSLWAWVIEALNQSDDRVGFALPQTPTWAAITFSRDLVSIAGEDDAYQLTEFVPLLVRSMVPWLARRN